jgi:acyl-coenzyme A thioesterase PaaI-like protein
MPVMMTVGALERFLATEFPQVFKPESGVTIEAVWDGGCRVRQAFNEVSIRPGGTISGPTMMALADFAMYVAVLAGIGPVPLAVTINLNINFLRKPGPRDLLAEAGDRRGDHPLGRRRGARRPCHLDLFDPAQRQVVSSRYYQTVSLSH